MNEQLEEMRSMGFLDFLRTYGGRNGGLIGAIVAYILIKYTKACVCLLLMAIGGIIAIGLFGEEQPDPEQIEEEKVAAEANAKPERETETRAKPEREAEAKAKPEHETAIAKAKAGIAVMQAGTRPGETKTITLPGGAEMEMAWCPAGKFMMGSNNGEEDERPVNEVTLTKGFWIAKTEVTQAQWKSVMGNNPSYAEGANLPVEEVSWYDCQEFCGKTGLSLPTEAEWEYACRAGSSRPHAGTGWYSGNSEGKTHPVGQKQPNAWGLHDMHGNVSEWCADWYGDYPGGAVTDPTGAGSGANRVLRGGSCRDNASNCRSADRGRSDPGRGFGNAGFRPVARQD